MDRLGEYVDVKGGIDVGGVVWRPLAKLWYGVHPGHATDDWQSLIIGINGGLGEGQPSEGALNDVSGGVRQSSGRLLRGPHVQRRNSTRFCEALYDGCLMP